ncbi:endopolygalacturonase [bacterium]|nr:endopolygalacturonase [bacterium]
MTYEPSNLPTHGLNVADYGATGNGEADDSAAIQATLNAGSGLVVIPYGVYKIGRTLRLSSYTRLIVHPQARLFLAPGAGVDNHTHLLSNQHHSDGDVDIHVEGGIWDGNNPANLRGPDRPDSYTGVLMNFTNVRGLTLRSLTVRDPESYFIRLGQVSGFEVGHIRFEAPHLRPNQDGVHLGGHCEDGYIHDLSGFGLGTPNDDVVALNADDANYRAQNLGKLCGPIRRITVRNIRADDCHTFVRILSVNSPIEDIWVEDVRGGCRVAAVNMDACRECRVPLFDPNDPAVADGVGQVARVTLRNFNVYKSVAGNSKPLLDLRTRIRDLRIENFRRDRRDAALAVPTLRLAEFHPCTVHLEGLDLARAEPLSTALGLDACRLQRLASPFGPNLLRADLTIARRAALDLPGDFDLLTVNTTQRN